MNLNQKLILGLFFGCLISNSFVDNNDKSNFNPSYSSVKSAVILNGGATSESTPTVPVPAQFIKQQKVHRREMLRKHFPDWEERMEYQKKKKREKIYRSSLARIAEAKRLGVKFKPTKQEQDAFDYFNAENFYNYYQSLETRPNIFDTRSSFLLKVEKNREMRENFLKAYHRIKSEN